MTGNAESRRFDPVIADQGAVAAFLGDPASHGAGVGPVERIDTHGAMVFLAGARAYKVKRAVKYPYMDFSTLERRRIACAREVALNRRTAPDLYLGVAAIARRSDGTLFLGEPTLEAAASGPDGVVEWAVVMRRFPADALFEQLADGGRLTGELLARLGDEIRVFHDTAEVVARGPGGLAEVIEENAAELAERPDLFPAAAAQAYDSRVRAALDGVSDLLERRRAAGFLRRCHGDLHLRNVCLLDGRPTLFDAIEFNDAIACVDVLYDLAFLLMDLDRRGLRAEANLVLNRWLRDEADLEGLAALPLFLSVRAAIRAKVAASAEASQADAGVRAEKRAEAEAYFRAAADYLSPCAPCLVAVGGLSGSGKSRLARGLAPLPGRPPGAVFLRSDRLRKQLMGVPEETRLAPESYTAEASERIYRSLRDRARLALAAGQAVVVDAVHAKPAERAAIERVASDLGVAFTGLWLDAPEAILMARVEARRGDASDATAAVVKGQTAYETGEIAWHRLDATGTPEALLAAARRLTRCR